MLVYFLQISSSLCIILSLSVFLRAKLKFSENTSYFISIFFISIFIYIIFKFNYILVTKYEYNLILIKYLKLLFIFLLLISLVNIWKKAEFFNYIDIYFIIIFYIISLLTFDRYFLDEDEFSYWGKQLKLFLSIENFFDIETQIHGGKFYHEPFITSFQFFFVTLADYKENLIILANTTILLSLFFLLFGKNLSNKFSLNFFLYFISFYLLINNLSFGLVSIYADPIIALFLASILYYIFFLESKRENNLIIIFLLISILLSHRIGLLFFLLCIIFYTFIKFELLLKNKKIFYIYSSSLLLILSFIFLFKKLIFSKTLYDLFKNNFSITDFLTNLYENVHYIYLSNIYFSKLGKSFNEILKNVNLQDYQIPVFNLSILFWSILTAILILYSKKFKFFIAFLISLNFVIIIVFFEKVYLQNLSISVIGRYISILMLAFLIIQINNLKNKKILILFISLNVLFTPLKSFGFFVPDNIYYSKKENINFKNTRINIKDIAVYAKNCEYNYVNVYYDKEFFPNYLKKHYSLPLNILSYEIFPKKVKFFNIKDNYPVEIKNKCVIFLNISSSLRETENINLKIKRFNL